MAAQNPEYCYVETFEEAADRNRNNAVSHSSLFCVEVDTFHAGDRSYYTQDCYNCVGLAAIGPELGLLGHLERISPDFPTFQPVFNNALQALAFVQPRLIVLVGGRADYGTEPSDKIALADRTFAAEALTKFVQEDANNPELIIRWNTEQYEYVDLFVHTKEKRIVASCYLPEE